MVFLFLFCSPSRKGPLKKTNELHVKEGLVVSLYYQITVLKDITFYNNLFIVGNSNLRGIFILINDYMYLKKIHLMNMCSLCKDEMGHGQ